MPDRTNHPTCPQWCTAPHPRPDYLTHHHPVAELDAGDGYSVEVELAQHEQPQIGFHGAPVVRLAIEDDVISSTSLLDLSPGQAAFLGEVLTMLDDGGRQAFGRALLDAVAHIVDGEPVTPPDGGSAVEREATPNTSLREAEPHTGSSDGR